ncbi:MAG: hypothetical protein H6810_11355 [Phycisphaeraceae bacterium]|nr:MAG: hypothetical protein H6810_11355 [Phycisphaeraceae bacterium]
MLDIVLGPTFDMTLNTTSDEAEGTLATWIREGGCPFHAIRAGSHFTLTAPAATRHFWSPTLSLEVREADGKALVSGRFNPSPGIWTGYMFTYLALVTIALMAAMWGTAQIMLKAMPWAFALIPVCAVIAGVMFWISAVGQRLARPEMKAMHVALCGVLDIDEPGPPCCER